MPEVRIKAEPRTEFGKGAARRTRRAGKVPAVIYGHGTDPRHVALPGHELILALKTANVLLRVEVAGGTDQLALPKAVQRDPVKQSVEHVDLVIVRSGEKVTIDVPVTVHGKVGRRAHRAGPRRGLGRGRGDPHPERDRRRHRRPRGRRRGPRRRPDAARGHHAGRRRRPDRPGRGRADGRGGAGAEAEAVEGEGAGGRGRRAAEAADGAPPRATPTPSGPSRPTATALAGRRPGQPGPVVRRHPAQRRLHGASTCSPSGSAAGSRRTAAAPTWSRGLRRARCRRPHAGGAGQAEVVHERVRRPGRGAARLLQGARASGSSSSTTSSTCRSARCGSSAAAATTATTACAR